MKKKSPEPKNEKPVQHENLLMKEDGNPIKQKENENFIRKNLIQICTIIITFSTLVFTIDQGYKIRENNNFQNLKTQIYQELSVTPKLQFSNWSIINSGFEFKINNVGVGPAIVDDIIYRKNGKKPYSVKDLNSNFWYDIFKDFSIPEKVVYKNIQHYIVNSGGYIPADKEIYFFIISSKEMSKEDLLKTLNIFSDATFSIKYHSIYNLNFTDSTIFKTPRIIEMRN